MIVQIIFIVYLPCNMHWPRALQVLVNLLFTTTLWWRICIYPYFIEEDTGCKDIKQFFQAHGNNRIDISEHQK